MRNTSLGVFSLFFYFLILIFSPSMPVYSQSLSERDRCSALNLDFAAALRIGAANSFELRAIRAREGVYILALKESMREYFPSLTFSYAETEEVRRRESDDRISRLSVDSEILIYDGGTRSLNRRSAGLNSLLAVNDYRIAFNKLVVEVRKGYLELIRLSETEKIYCRTRDRAAMQLEFIKKEYELGDATRLEVMEIETKVKELELSARAAADEYHTALNSFKLLLRINWKRKVNISGNIESEFKPVPWERVNVDYLVSMALKKRKEIQSSMVQYEVNRNKYLINSSYYIPNVSLGFNYNISDEDFPPRKKGWGVNMKVSSRLFGSTLSGGTGYNESENKNSRAFSRNASVDVFNDVTYKRSILESRIEMARSGEQIDYVKQSITLEVATACSSMLHAGEMIGISEKRLNLYDSQLVIERLRAQMGEVRRYDLLEKEIERGSAAVELLDSKISYISSLGALETAIGADIGFMNNHKGGQK